MLDASFFGWFVAAMVLAWAVPEGYKWFAIVACVIFAGATTCLIEGRED